VPFSRSACESLGGGGGGGAAAPPLILCGGGVSHQVSSRGAPKNSNVTHCKALCFYCKVESNTGSHCRVCRLCRVSQCRARTAAESVPTLPSLPTLPLSRPPATVNFNQVPGVEVRVVSLWFPSWRRAVRTLLLLLLPWGGLSREFCCPSHHHLATAIFIAVSVPTTQCIPPPHTLPIGNVSPVS
jgi:hypothetical protein